MISRNQPDSSVRVPYFSASARPPLTLTFYLNAQHALTLTFKVNPLGTRHSSTVPCANTTQNSSKNPPVHPPHRRTSPQQPPPHLPSPRRDRTILNPALVNSALDNIPTHHLTNPSSNDRRVPIQRAPRAGQANVTQLLGASALDPAWSSPCLFDKTPKHTSPPEYFLYRLRKQSARRRVFDFIPASEEPGGGR